MRAILSFVLLLVTAAVVSCEGPMPLSLAARFQDENPKVRIEAIAETARSKDNAALPFLVDRLTDTEPDVRFFAIGALKDLTGQALGYKHYQPAKQRNEAVERWRQWLRKTRGGGGKPGAPAP